MVSAVITIVKPDFQNDQFFLYIFVQQYTVSHFPWGYSMGVPIADCLVEVFSLQHQLVWDVHRHKEGSDIDSVSVSLHVHHSHRQGFLSAGPRADADWDLIFGREV